MSIDAAIAIAWDVLKMGFAPIKRGFEYVMSSKSLAADLRKEVGNLENEAERVGVLETEAGNNVRSFHNVFTTWKESAVEALKEARDLLEAFDKATKTCCYGTLPDPKCRYQFSKDAEDKIEVIKKLARQGGEFKELNHISFIGHAPGNVVTARNPARRVQSPRGTDSVSSASTSIKPREDGLFESRALMIQKVMDALANTSNSVVGIYGMGGIGKSTLLVEVEKRIREERSFDLVAKADVSENPDIRRIQEEIAHWLGLTDMKKEENVTLRAELLHKRLEKEEREKKKVLIILDNLWVPLDLKSVGIPCGLDNKAIGCKLLLTSRSENVLLREMRCDNAFPLGVLKEEEAERLFEKIGGDKVHEKEFKHLVEKALHICAGLPFLIVAIAKLFINTSHSDCEDALKRIWNEKTGEAITNTLQLSYDRISNEAKSLLRLCVAYGLSRPSLEHLARHGFGLGIFRNVNSMQEGRVRLLRLIHNLQASSLLLAGDEDVDRFKIHDLVREFVATTDPPLLVLKDKDNWGAELSEAKLKSCKALCFPYTNLKKLPKKLLCPELDTFFLFKKNRSSKILDSYFNSMKNLKVLHLIGIRLSPSRSPFQFLENLRSLCLDHSSLEDVAILGELKGLQILSLRSSDIPQLPKEIGQLVELRLLDLSHCSQLEIIEPDVLGKLTKLEELYMEDSFDQWSAVEKTAATNASLLELNNMTKLHTLHVFIRDPSSLPEDLNFQRLTNYRIEIGKGDPRRRPFLREGERGRRLQPRFQPKSQRSTILGLNCNSKRDFLSKGCMQSILCKTEQLFLDGLRKKDKRSIWALSPEGYPQLKQLMVVSSPSVHYIIKRSSRPAFKALEKLLLENMVNLEKITSNNISSSESFTSLSVVRVTSCNKMEVLFPRSVARELRQLQKIEVDSCELMRGIVEADDDRGKFELPKLRVLELRNLPNIENFVTTGSSLSSSTSNDQVGVQIAFFDGQQVAFPSLEELYIVGMHNIEMIWDDQVTVDSFSKLNSLYVSQCHTLVNVVPSIVLGRLLSLERLEARSCDPLTVIFKFQPLNPLDGHPIARSPLKELQLFDLPKLKCIRDKELHYQAIEGTSHELKVSFPFLESLKIGRLPNLEEIWSVHGSLAISNLSKW